jgi:PAS domain S-box-containing protein
MSDMLSNVTSDQNAARGSVMRVRLLVLIPLTLLIVALTAAIALVVVAHTRARVREESDEAIARVSTAFDIALQEDANMLSATLEAISRDGELQAAFQSRDRQELLALAEPLYRELNGEYHISHFYFLTPDRTCFLRVHQPEQWGDAIDRFTALQAEETQQTGKGVELGPLGTFTLRVVLPWYDDGELIGYLELGEEIDHTIAHMQQYLGMDLAMAVKKDALDQVLFESAGDAFDTPWPYVIMAQTAPDLPVEVMENLGKLLPADGQYGRGLLLPIGGEKHHVSYHEFRDAAGRAVAELIVMRSVAAESGHLVCTSWWTSVACGLVGLGMVVFFWFFLGRIETRLVNQAEGIVASEEFLQTVIDTIPDSLRVLDMDRRIILANEATRRMVGWQEPVGMTCREISHHRNAPCAGNQSGECPFQTASESLQPTTLIHSYLTEKEEERFAEISAAPVLDFEGRVVQIVETCRDVTARVRSEAELADAIERANLMTAEAELANAAKSDFLANMSHEIRTPMTAILGFAEQLKNPDITEAQREGYVNIIERNGRNLLELINDILDLSKIEAGKLTLEILPTDLTQVIADVASTMRVRAVDKGLDLRVEYTTPLPAKVHTDPTRVRQSLVNLVGNAIKFTEQGEVCIAVTFLPRWIDDAPVIRIQVADTGVGMDRATMNRLFAPFVQADASTSRRFGGTGLGLTITKSIIEMLGGEVTVDSHVDEGSVFTLMIPTGCLDGVEMIGEPSEAEAGASHRGPVPGGEHPLAGYRILLAEDGYDNQVLLGAILRKAGARVDIVEDGVEAVSRLDERSAAYDVIVMDMQMPRMDGYQTSRVLRQKGLGLPIIALTAHAMAGDRGKCINAGCTDYCTKPVDKSKLIQAITRHAAPGLSVEAFVPPMAITSDYVDDPDLADIIGGFVGRLSETISAMRALLEKDDRRELQRQAHQLKGAGGGYGYPAITDAAKALEDAVKADDMAQATSALDALDAVCQAVIAGHDESSGGTTRENGQ